MMIKSKIILFIGVVVFALFCGVELCLASIPVSANIIYKQASEGNIHYLNLIRRYSGVVDTKNKSGDTAYCLA